MGMRSLLEKLNRLLGVTGRMTFAEYAAEEERLLDSFA